MALHSFTRHDPEIRALTRDVRELVDQAKVLVSEIEETVVTLDSYRTRKRERVASLIQTPEDP